MTTVLVPAQSVRTILKSYDCIGHKVCYPAEEQIWALAAPADRL